MLVVVVSGLFAAAAVPQVMSAVDRMRTAAAARYVASRMALARLQAVTRSATIALRFVSEPRGITFGVFVDGNRNGVRVRDIQAGVDPEMEPPVLLADLFPGVEVAVSPGTGIASPVQLGGTDLLSFTPSGTATSGSIYILGRDGSQFAVRVLGATGRCRVLRYDGRSGSWSDVY